MADPKPLRLLSGRTKQHGNGAREVRHHARLAEGLRTKIDLRAQSSCIRAARIALQKNQHRLVNPALGLSSTASPMPLRSRGCTIGRFAAGCRATPAKGRVRRRTHPAQPARNTGWRTRPWLSRFARGRLPWSHQSGCGASRAGTRLQTQSANPIITAAKDNAGQTLMAIKAARSWRCHNDAARLSRGGPADYRYPRLSCRRCISPISGATGTGSIPRRSCYGSCSDGPRNGREHANDVDCEQGQPSLP